MTPPLDQQLIRASFGAAVDTYESASALQREVSSRLAERLELVRIKPDRVLDLGCGPGHGSRELGRRYPDAEIIALDAAQPMLSVCPRRLGWRRPLKRLCGDARALPLADASIDLVWSNLVLQWVDEPSQAFAEIARVLRPDGVAMFTTFGPDTLKELRQAWAAVDDGAHVNRFLDMHDLGDGLLQAGLREPVMDMEMLTLTYADPWQLMRELKNMGAHNVATERRRTLTGRDRIKAMVEAYHSLFPGEQRIGASWELVYGLAWGAATGQARAEAGGQIATFPVERLRGSRPPGETT